MELTMPKAGNFSTKSQSDWLRSLVVASLVALAAAGPAHAAVSPAAFKQFPAQSVYTGKRVPPQRSNSLGASIQHADHRGR
jgi:hypothetical protein